MKIGIVRNNLTSAGGAERYSLNLIERLLANGDEVHAFTTSVPAALENRIKSHIFHPHRRLLGRKVKLQRFLRQVAFQNWLRDELAKCPLDLLFTLERTWPSDVFRAGDGVHKEWLKICLEGAGALKGYATRMQAFHRRILADELAVFNANNTRLVICNSQMVADEIAANYNYPRERVRVVPNAVDFERFRPAEPAERQRLRETNGFGADELVLLFVGSGFWRKGLDIAIDIVAELKKRNAVQTIKLCVVGKGGLEIYRQQAARLGVTEQMKFVGSAAPDEVLQWYQLADIFLFPTRYDPFANVCLEANACGLPVVSTNRNGFCEQTKEGINGIVLDIHASPATMAAAIEPWLTKRASSDEIRDAIAHLSLDRHVTKLMETLQELMPVCS